MVYPEPADRDSRDCCGGVARPHDGGMLFQRYG